MAAVIADLAQAVVDALNSRKFSAAEFSAERKDWVECDVDELATGDVRVLVSPASSKSKRETRDLRNQEKVILVAVIMKLDATLDTSAGLSLLEEIDDYLDPQAAKRKAALPSYVAANYVSSESPIAYDPDELSKLVFLSYLRVTYRVLR